MDAAIVGSFSNLLQAFAPCFSAPSMATFQMLMTGWVLNLRRHTITEVVRAAGAVDCKHISSFHRFFSKAVWALDKLGLILVNLIIKHLVPTGIIRLVVDDTLGRHCGKRIAAASMHRDPLLSTGQRASFSWGHVWVVLAIEVTLFDKNWALPVLFRLHCSEKLCKKQGQPYRKITDQAQELVKLIASNYPQRQFQVLGDAAYTNSSLIKNRCSNVHLIGRGRLDAALYAPAPKRRKGQMGRPRVRGKPIPSPAKQAASKRARWKKITVHVYGREVTVSVLVIDALWYVAAGSELIRQVVVRGFPGHERDDVFVSTNISQSAAAIIEEFSKRWSLEVTFHETKGKLGFEDPQNRTKRSVERTAPMAFVSYSLTVLWYVLYGQYSKAAQGTTLPWYPQKETVAFSDMLATLRRASWRARLFDPGASASELRKRIMPLVDYFATAA